MKIQQKDEYLKCPIKPELLEKLSLFKMQSFSNFEEKIIKNQVGGSAATIFSSTAGILADMGYQQIGGNNNWRDGRYQQLGHIDG
jgi:hypothetical protein